MIGSSAPDVLILETDSIPWERSASQDKLTKILNRDPRTGAYTCISRTPCPPPGPPADPKPHYHLVDDELLCLEGEFLLDQPIPFQRLSYSFCPAGTVHGFIRRIDRGFTVLGRFSGPVTWHRAPVSGGAMPYPADGADPLRPCTVVLKPDVDGGLRQNGVAGSAALSVCLSAHPVTDERTSLIKLLPGWSGSLAAGPRRSYWEMFILEGSVVDSKAGLLPQGAYRYFGDPFVAGDLETHGGALIYLCEGRRLAAPAAACPTVKSIGAEGNGY